MARAKGNGRDVLVERMVEHLARIERNTAEMGKELGEVRTELGHVRTELRVGLQQVNDRLDGIREIAGEKYRDLEQRVRALERKGAGRP